jgi:hypothetical protein
MQNKHYTLTQGAIRYTYQCSPFETSLGIVRDAPQSLDSEAARNAAWETFGTPNLHNYFASGIEKFRASFDDFADVSKPITAKDEAELSFMLEALIHARQLLSIL